MKNLLFILLLFFLNYSCSTTNKVTNQAMHDAIIGQNEMVVFERLGAPARVEHLRNGGKVMIYESSEKGMFLTPYRKPPISYNLNRDPLGEVQGWTYTSNTNTTVNDPKYTIYPITDSYLKVYIDENGNAVKLEHNIPSEQLEMYHERFKHFRPYR